MKGSEGKSSTNGVSTSSAGLKGGKCLQCSDLRYQETQEEQLKCSVECENLAIISSVSFVVPTVVKSLFSLVVRYYLLSYIVTTDPGYNTLPPFIVGRNTSCSPHRA